MFVLDSFDISFCKSIHTLTNTDLHGIGECTRQITGKRDATKKEVKVLGENGLYVLVNSICSHLLGFRR